MGVDTVDPDEFKMLGKEELEGSWSGNGNGTESGSGSGSGSGRRMAQERWGRIRVFVENSAKSMKEKVVEINESEQVTNFKANAKRRSSASWEKTCVVMTAAAHKSSDFATKTKDDILIPTWEKTCNVTSAAVKKGSETTKPLLSKTVDATKTTANKVSEASSKVYREDVKPAAGKAKQAISTSARKASITAQTIFKTSN